MLPLPCLAPAPRQSTLATGVPCTAEAVAVFCAAGCAGGRHHAHKDKAAGFCYVNDVVGAAFCCFPLLLPPPSTLLPRRRAAPHPAPAPAASPQGPVPARPRPPHRYLLISSFLCSIPPQVLAILALLGRFRRVLYVDIDVHHGDAVEASTRWSACNASAACACSGGCCHAEHTEHPACGGSWLLRWAGQPAGPVQATDVRLLGCGRCSAGGVWHDPPRADPKARGGLFRLS